MPWGFVATIANIIVGLCISYTAGKRLFYMAGVILIPMVGTILQFVLLTGPRGVLLFGYYLTGAYNAPYVMLLALVTSNTAGTTKKIVTSGIVWVAYCAGETSSVALTSNLVRQLCDAYGCVGNIAGPFFFSPQDAPRYRPGTGVILGSFVLQCLMSLGFRVYLLWLNKQKEREESEAQNYQEDSAMHAFADLTDKQVSLDLH